MKKFQPDELHCVKGEHGLLGRGSFGTVMLAFHDVHNVLALKCMEVHGGNNLIKSMESSLKGEMELLQSCNHENIVRLHGWTKWPDTFAMVMEYLPGGNLKELVLRQDVHVGLLLQLRICAEMANGLSFIHNLSKEKRLVHGDVKPENVVLTMDLHCKISDFGSAKISSYTGKHTTTGPITSSEERNHFTEFYAPPELLRYPLKKLKPSMDTYSYGMTMFVVLGQDGPINSDVKLEIFKNSILNGHRPDLEDICEKRNILHENGDIISLGALDALEATMKNCWKHDPSDRPTMLEVKETLHTAVAGIPTDQILQCATDTVKQIKIRTPLRSRYECIPADQLKIFCPKDDQRSSLTNLPKSSLISESSGDNVLESALQNQTTETRSSFTNLPKTSLISESSGDNVLESTLQNQTTETNTRNQLHGSALVATASSKTMTPSTTPQHLVSTDGIVRQGDAIIDDVIKFAQSLHKKSEYVASIKHIEWTLQICENIIDTENRFSKLYDCCNLLNDVSFSMSKANKNHEIEKYCLPLLLELKKKFDSVERDDFIFKAKCKTWCMIYVGNCYNRVDQHARAEQIGRSCLTSLNSLYGQNANKHKVLSACYNLLACANHNSKNYEKAIEFWKLHIKALQTAEDITEERRKQRIEDADIWLSDTQELISMAK